MEVLSDLLGQLSNAKTEVLFGVALYVIGAVLKRIPAIPNVVIPVVLVFIVGPVVGYFIFDNPGAADFQLKHPEFRAVMIGMIIAAVVCFFHDQIGRYAEKLLPAWLKNEPQPQSEIK